jgi:cobalt-zinc-cadmium efflux system outer membrane protein
MHLSFCRRASVGYTLLLVLASTSAGAQEPASITLDEVIRRALATNPLVEAARQRVRAAQGSRVSAGTIPNPLLTYQIENAGFFGRSAPGGLEAEKSTFATMPLEFLYQRRPRIARADEEIRAAQAELTSARWLVVLDVSRAFGRVATAQATLDTASELRRGIEELITYNQKRVSEGVAPEGDLIRVQVEGDRAALEETLARAELAAAWADLRPFLGIELVPRRVSIDSASPGIALPDLAELTVAAETRQPEIIAARARAAGLRAEESYQHTLRLRQAGINFGTKQIGSTWSMIAGVTLPLPLFDQNRGEIARAAAERAAAERELEWTERTVVAHLQAAHERATVLRSALAILAPDLVRRAQSSRDIALAAYREGAGTLLQVLDATRAIAETRQTLMRALLAQRESTFDVYASAGFDPAEIPSIGVHP